MVSDFYFINNLGHKRRFYDGLYKKHIIYNEEMAGDTLDDILLNIKKENRADVILGGFCKMGQIFFDGSINYNIPIEYNEQKDMFNDLMDTGKRLAYITYYSGDNSDIGGIKRDIERLGEKLEVYSNIKAKGRHLAFRRDDVMEYGKMLYKFKDKNNIDTIVGVMSGALEPVFLAMNIFKEIEFIPIRYSYYAQSDKEVKRPKF